MVRSKTASASSDPAALLRGVMDGLMSTLFDALVSFAISDMIDLISDPSFKSCEGLPGPHCISSAPMRCVIIFGHNDSPGGTAARRSANRNAKHHCHHPSLEPGACHQ